MTPRVKQRIRWYKFIGRLKSKLKVDNRAGKVGCILWTGRIVSDEWGFYQYGTAVHDGHRWAVHRALWEDTYGSLGKKKLRNKCGNTLCVAPAHWEAVNHWKDKQANV